MKASTARRKLNPSKDAAHHVSQKKDKSYLEMQVVNIVKGKQDDKLSDETFLYTVHPIGLRFLLTRS